MSEQPPDDGVPESAPGQQAPYNPYAQPDSPGNQPLWQGHQAPQQGWSAYPTPAGAGRRRMWLIVLVAILLLVVAGGAVTAVVLMADEDAETISVDDLETKQCFDAGDLGGDGGQIDSIMEADCDAEHDAEAFATLELGADEDLEDAGARCVDELDGVGATWADLHEDGIEVRPLGAGNDEGDKVVCFIRNQDGSPLTGSEFE